jgi:hypothetical protein
LLRARRFDPPSLPHSGLRRPPQNASMPSCAADSVCSFGTAILIGLKRTSKAPDSRSLSSVCVRRFQIVMWQIPNKNR